MKILFSSIVLFSLNLPLFAQVYSDESYALADTLQQLIDAKGENNLEVADYYIKLGDSYMESAHYEKAVETFNTALDIKLKHLEEENLDVADVCFKLANAEFEFGNDSVANALFKKVLDIRLEQLGEDNFKVAECQIKLGLSNAFLGDIEKSIDLVKIGLQIQIDSLGKNHISLSNVYHDLGIVYQISDNYAEAEKLHKRALQIRLDELGASHLKIAETYMYLGLCYKNDNKEELALEFLEKALNTRLENLDKNHLKLAESYFYLGEAYTGVEDFKKAVKLFGKTLKIKLIQLSKNNPDLAKCYDRLAIAYNFIPNPKQSIKFVNKATEIWINRLGENHSNVAKCYVNLALFYSTLGKYDKSIEYNKKALKLLIFNHGELHLPVATSFFNLSISYSNIGDYHKSIYYNKRAIEIAQELSGENSFGVAHFSKSLANTLRNLGNYDEALDLNKKTLKIMLSIYGSDHFKLAYHYHGLGLSQLDLGSYEQALNLFKNALELSVKKYGNQDHRNVGYYFNIAKVYYAMNDYEQSLIFLDKASNAKIKYYDTNDELKYAEFQTKLHQKLKDFEIIDSLWSAFIPQGLDQTKNIYIFLTNDQRINYLDKVSNYYKSFYAYTCTSLKTENIELASNLLINTKSLVLDYNTSVNQIISEINDEQLINLNDSLITIKLKIDKTEQLSEEKKKEINIDSIRIDRDNIASEILAHPSIKSRLNFDEIKWQQVQDKLQLNEAMIDHINFYSEEDSTEMYYAMLISKNYENPQFIKLGSEKEIKPYFISESKESAPRYMEIKEDRKALHQLIWQPLLPYLEGINTVHLSPTGLLNKVDYDILQNETGEYLTDNYQFHYYTSTRDFVNKTTNKANYNNALLMGHILFDAKDKQAYEEEEELFDLALNRTVRDGIKPLPNTLEEVKTIDAICGRNDIISTTLTVDDASEDTVRYFVGDRSPDIYHFATHGVFIEPSDTLNRNKNSLKYQMSLIDNPMQRSVLMFAGANHTWSKGERYFGTNNDGILTAAEVANLNFTNTDLVVLSACNTGLGSIHNTEGVFGLQRAFKLAGVDKILVSLWPVNDTITKDLMILFYHNLLELKQDAATALRNAKAEMRKRNDIPRFWAGFVLVE